MKVLAATKRTQGRRTNDFSYLRDGELVYFGFDCDTDRGDPDGSCGCARSFTGLESRVCGTTAEVVDLELSKTEFADRLRASLVDSGYGALIDATLSKELSEELLRLAASFPAGTVLERRGEELIARR